MVKQLIRRLLPARNDRSQGRQKLFFDRRPELIYVIGDVHGCMSLLRKMESIIAADAEACEGEKWIVLLGDYVDRGPESAAVLDHLLARPPAGFRRFCLAGNHEQLMLSYLAAPDSNHFWLGLGGHDTLRSYGLYEMAERSSSMKALLESHVPSEHVDFLQTAPSLLAVPGFVFVHGGIRTGVALEEQADEDLLWLRPSPDTTSPANVIIVHGHTPVDDVEISQGRINVDTGAYATGLLSCVRIDRNNGIVKLAAS